MRLERDIYGKASSVNEFQFHKGAIRTVLHAAVRLHHLDFNSIKVRLEQQGGNIYYESPEFQFHKGAIRTNKKSVTLPLVSNFNSIKVRLEQSKSRI